MPNLDFKVRMKPQTDTTITLNTQRLTFYFLCSFGFMCYLHITLKIYILALREKSPSVPQLKCTDIIQLLFVYHAKP